MTDARDLDFQAPVDVDRPGQDGRARACLAGSALAGERGCVDGG